MKNIVPESSLPKLLCEVFDHDADVSLILNFLLDLLVLPVGPHADVLAFLTELPFCTSQLLPKIIPVVEALYARSDWNRGVKRACVAYFSRLAELEEPLPLTFSSMVTKELPSWIAAEDLGGNACSLLSCTTNHSSDDFLPRICSEASEVFSVFAKKFKMYLGEKINDHFVSLGSSLLYAKAGDKALQARYWDEGDAFGCCLLLLEYLYHSITPSSARLQYLQPPGVAHRLLYAFSRSGGQLKRDHQQVFARISAKLEDPSSPFLDARRRAQQRRDAGHPLPYPSHHEVGSPAESLIFFDEYILCCFENFKKLDLLHVIDI